MAHDSEHRNPFLDSGLASTTMHPLGLEVERAEGAWLQLTDGRRIMDAISGIGVSNFGHQEPTIHGRLRKQLDAHLHTMVYGEMVQSVQQRAGALVLDTMPSALDCVYFVNSGAEAVDAALKLAKRTTGRSRLIAVQGGYHGNTHGALSVSSNESRKSAYRPLLPDVEFLGWNDPKDVSQIDDTVACVIVETVQGDAGIRIPDASWLQALRRRCDEVGALLVLDEIQCGMGRTGTPWAFLQFDVVPDMVCMGKALGGGMPVGALVASKQAMSQFAQNPSLGHITTFGGHPLVCAGVEGALTCMNALDWAVVESRNRVWQEALSNHPAVTKTRRLGAFHAVELASPQHVETLVHAALDATPTHGVLAFWFLSVPHAFRLAPPLNASQEAMDEGLRLLMLALDQCV